jgi:hypothetical protein
MQTQNKNEPITDLAHSNTRRELARVIGRLFGKWELSLDQQLALLGLDSESHEVLGQYHRGERSLPSDRGTLERAGHLLAIHAALRRLFPEDPELRFSWVHRRNRGLDGRAPLAVMQDDGLTGIARVLKLLEIQTTE